MPFCNQCGAQLSDPGLNCPRCNSSHSPSLRDREVVHNTSTHNVQRYQWLVQLGLCLAAGLVAAVAFAQLALPDGPPAAIEISTKMFLSASAAVWGFVRAWTSWYERVVTYKNLVLVLFVVNMLAAGVFLQRVKQSVPTSTVPVAQEAAPANSPRNALALETVISRWPVEYGRLVGIPYTEVLADLGAPKSEARQNDGSTQLVYSPKTNGGRTFILEIGKRHVVTRVFITAGPGEDVDMSEVIRRAWEFDIKSERSAMFKVMHVSAIHRNTGIQLVWYADWKLQSGKFVAAIIPPKTTSFDE